MSKNYNQILEDENRHLREANDKLRQENIVLNKQISKLKQYIDIISCRSAR